MHDERFSFYTHTIIKIHTSSNLFSNVQVDCTLKSDAQPYLRTTYLKNSTRYNHFDVYTFTSFNVVGMKFICLPQCKIALSFLDMFCT